MITQTRSGKVEGYEEDGVAVFKGIPYAAPPIGARRWMAPEREDAWDDVRDATAFSPQSAQGAFAMNAMLGGPEPVVSEDSLYLNVWTPACDDAKRPVMVWIHGGAFVFGSGDTPWYDGTAFAKQGDVVVVTLNYRLGAFGFLHLADLFGAEFEGSGNAGILDQAAALEWVRDSIAAFGGDPENVTVFGESAGGGSVGTLLGMPAARGLFNKAIPQSGASSWWATRERATAIAQEFIDKLGVKAGDTDTLRALSTDALIAGATGLGSLSAGAHALAFQPVVDGTSLPQPPLDTIEAGNAEGVHLLVGTNRHEATLFNFMDADLQNIDDAGIATRVASVVRRRREFPRRDLPEPARRRDEPRAVDRHRQRRGVPHPGDQARGDATRARTRVDVPVHVGDTGVRWHPQGVPCARDPVRVRHARRTAPMFTGDAPERQAIADAMHAAWIAFARHR